jgi:hypothetical protein
MRIRANSADCKSALRHAATSRKAAALALTMASFSGSRPRYIGNPKPPRHGSAWETLFSANPVLTSGVRAVNHAAVLPIVRRLCLGWRCRGLAVTKRGPLPARSGIGFRRYHHRRCRLGNAYLLSVFVEPLRRNRGEGLAFAEGPERWWSPDLVGRVLRDVQRLEECQVVVSPL